MENQFLIDSEYLSRLTVVFSLLFKSGSIKQFSEQLRLVDGSAWDRIGPLISTFSEMNLFDFHTWLGHGIGSNVDYYTALVNENTVIRGGFWQSAIYDYGLIGIITIVTWIYRNCKTVGIIMLAYMVLCFTNCALPTQAFWFIVLMMIWISKEEGEMLNGA